jgi:hypothetical protein
MEFGLRVSSEGRAANSLWYGQAEAMAILIRRTETVTRAPILSREQIELAFLDPVFHVAAGAVDLFVKRRRSPGV